MNKLTKTSSEQLGYTNMEIWPDVPSNIVRLIATRCCPTFDWQDQPKTKIIRVFKLEGAHKHCDDFIRFMESSQEMYEYVYTMIRHMVTTKGELNMIKVTRAPFEQLEYISMETWPGVPSNIVRLIATRCCPSYNWKGKPKTKIIRAFKSEAARKHYGESWSQFNSEKVFQFDPIKNRMECDNFIHFMDLSQEMYESIDTIIRQMVSTKGE